MGSRILQPNGVYIAISHGQPSYRLTYLQRPEFGWNVKIYTVQKPMMGMSASLAWHARRWHHGRHARWSNRKPWRHSTQSRSLWLHLDRSWAADTTHWTSKSCWSGTQRSSW